MMKTRFAALLCAVTLLAVSCESEPAAVEFTRGTLSSDTYTNESLGLVFTQSEDVELLEHSEMAAAIADGLDIYADNMGDGFVDEYTEKVLSVTEMIAYGANDSSVVISVNDLPFANATEGDIAAILSKQYTATLPIYTIDDAGEAADITEKATQTVTEEELWGGKYTCLTVSLNDSSSDMVWKDFVRAFPDCYVRISFTYTDAAELDALLACFTEK